MVSVKSSNFLPSIYRTKPNKKFLAATLDQLLSEPNFVKLNGYIGRRFSPTYKQGDSYITEPTAERTNYQLEPSAVVTDETGAVKFFSSYTDLLQQIEYYGGLVDNHSRLFENEYYTFNGQIDFDKLVNFNSYYWVPNGPDAIDIFSGAVDNERTYYVTRSEAEQAYQFSGLGDARNPDIMLARGGVYEFVLNQPGKQFWIQTNPGIDGTRNGQPNINTREVYGVENNGSESGVVVFRVPQIDAQEQYINMPLVRVVDLATTLPFNSIDNVLLDVVLENFGGIDGVTDLQGKYLAFVSGDMSDELWDENGVYAYGDYGQDPFDNGYLIPSSQRVGVWQISLEDAGDADQIVRLNFVQDIPVNSKIYISSGSTFANIEFHKASDGYLYRVPLITSTLSELYYNDGSDQNFYGRIRIVSDTSYSIDVENDILGKDHYTSPNGVVFTNGMKVLFDSQTIPAEYAEREYYVEGVGKSIRLVAVDQLVTPELDEDLSTIPYDIYSYDMSRFDQILNGPLMPDYITINRSSIDGNAWSRSNRWFHISTIEATAEYNKTDVNYSIMSKAKRPIIEFSPDLKLFNNGYKAQNIIDIFDYDNPLDPSSITDAMSQVEGTSDYQNTKVYFLDNYVLYKDAIYLSSSERNSIDPAAPDSVDYDSSKLFWEYFLTAEEKQKVDSAPTYSSTVTYSVGDYVSYSMPLPPGSPPSTPTPDPAIYECKVATVGNDPAPGVYWKQRLTPMEKISVDGAATYVTDTCYFLNDYVIYNGDVYKCIAQKTTIDPSIGGTNNYWRLVFNSFTDGMRIVFANDEDPLVRTKVYQVYMLDINGVNKIHLVETGEVLTANDTLVSVSGNNKGLSYWLNGSAWTLAQQKTATNQPPLFDMIDSDGHSFGDTTIYENSTFSGTKLFSYTVGTGSADKVLGFPLSYRYFNNVGDILFTNDFDSDSFLFFNDSIKVEKAINDGFIPEIVDASTVTPINVWTKNKEYSKQYQIFSNVYEGITPVFYIDVLPSGDSTVPYIKVYVNSKRLSTDSFEIVEVGARYGVSITSELAVGDAVDVLIYSNDVSKTAYYEIPVNLNANSMNDVFKSLTLGQFRNHVVAIASNSTDVEGQVPGKSNLRDIDIIDHGGAILQHSSPVVYSSLFLVDNEANFIDALNHSRHEYTRFKNRFLEQFSSVVDAGLVGDASAAVSYAISKLNRVKNIESPWYYSDMVPYDENNTEIEYTVLDVQIKEYEIDSIFDDATLSNKAILVYHNGVQMIKGLDYEFSKIHPSVVILREIDYDDVITIRIYHDTDGNYIPETPSKMGIYPKFRPEMFLDDTYQTPVKVIRGHDGSITPAFNDFRDDMLLELEKRIYNNIKVSYENHTFDINSIIPGMFRDTSFTNDEYNRILVRGFLEWVSNNKLDYSTNQWFDPNNAWTWVYSDFVDPIKGEPLPGFWRGVYQYFFDTDAPHQRPWEMLGFSEMPAWWEDTYGPAPYTGGNLVLWQDLEDGRIAAGDRQGIDARYVRPGLTSIIPVDEHGELRSPEKFAVKEFSSLNANGTFTVGDIAPVEAAWRRSSDFPFAVHRAIALMKPALYFGQLGNVQSYRKDSVIDQYAMATTHRRIQTDDLVINGAEGRNAGYLNWITDYLTSMGVDPVAKIRGYLDNLEIKLGYKAAGFTDKKYLTVLAEQNSPSSINESIIVPADDYTIHLHKSSPVDRLVYSAVIIEKVESGYSVTGYNNSNPFFTIIPSEVTSNKKSVSIAGVTGTIYKDYQQVKLLVPYGYSFSTKQQVVDFLTSYGRYLESQGFVFETFDENLTSLRNWELSAKEFLTWSQQGWETGSVLVLSPVLNEINLITDGSVVDEINNLPAGSKVLDLNFKVVKPSSFSVTRESQSFSFEADQTITIGLLDVSLVQYEHALIFNNETSFKDVIYKPELGNRQYRLKLIGNKTGDWIGQIAPPGFVYNSPAVAEWESGKDYHRGELTTFKGKYFTALDNIIATDKFIIGQWKQIDKSEIKTGLLPNFAYNAKKFEYMYDVDSQLQDQDINKYSNGLIGFRERSYLTDLGVNVTSQTKFYQGYIRDKGTKEAFNSLADATFSNLGGSIDYHEEWGFRVGEYGSLESRQFLEVQLDDGVFVDDPMTVRFLADDETSDDVDVVGLHQTELYKRPTHYSDSIFTNRSETSIYEDDIRTAGYVNLSDVTTTVFDITDSAALATELSNVVAGNTFWVAKDNTRDWNVYRVDETDVAVVQIDYELDNMALVTFNKPHGLNVNNIFVIKSFSDEFDGFYKVDRVDSIYGVYVTITDEQETLMVDVPNVTGDGLLYVFTSHRLQTQSEVDSIVPKYGWKTGDKIWVDSDRNIGGWSVFEKKNAWVEKTELVLTDITDYQTDTGLGRSAVLSDDLLQAAVGHPGLNAVRLFNRTNVGKYINTQNIDAPAGVTEFGYSLATADGKLVVGAPASDTVFVYAIASTGEVSLVQTLAQSAGERFGQSVAVDRDASMLYVGASESGKCYAYKLSNITEYETTVVRDSINGLGPYDIGFTPYVDPLDPTYPNIVVSNSAVVLTYGIDYTITGSTITFTDPTPMLTGHYVKQINYFQEVSQIVGTGLSAGDLFGYAVATNDDGSLVTVTAPGKNSTVIDSGSAYVFSFDGSAFAQLAELLPPTNVSSSLYGRSVAMDGTGDNIFIGAPNYRSSTFDGGAVIRWVRDSWDAPAQVIINPFNETNEDFGTQVTFDRFTDTLFVSGLRADLRNTITFDTDTTVFDAESTYFSDVTKDSGAVFVFNRSLGDSEATDKFTFSQQLIGDEINSGDRFGTSIAAIKNIAIVTSERHSDDNGVRVGSIHEFENESGDPGWTRIRYQQPKVDLRNIYRLFMYNKRDQLIVAHLDFIDPAKGKFLGIADQELTYKTAFDPANYNTGTSTTVAIDDSFYWGENQVGRVWLNLSKVRFIDYEQDTLSYRTTNWGRMFPGSVVEVAEWVESSVKPSAYTGRGTPLYPNDEAYVIQSYVDGISGIIKSKYYFWVIDKDETPPNIGRRLSTVAIKSAITSPLTQGIPFAAIVRDDALSLFSSADLLNADETILHVDYSLTETPGLIHNEYELVPEGSDQAIIPSRIMNKLIDSLVGEDATGNSVPDIELNAAERYGIGLRPRQTMIVNRLTAVKNLVDYVNRIFAENQIVGNFDLTKMMLADPEPTSAWDVRVANLLERDSLDTSLFDIGTLVLVVDDSEFNDCIIYEFNGSGYVLAYKSPLPESGWDKKVVDLQARDDLNTSILHVGSMILVERDSDYHNHWNIYEFNGLGYELKPKNSKQPEGWDYKVANLEERSYLDPADLSDGDIILVQSDSDYNGQWTEYVFAAATGTYRLVRVQVYDTTDYWTYSDWYAADYDYTVKPTFTVATDPDIGKLTIESGDIVKVKDHGDGKFIVYRYTDDGVEVVGLEDGTIQLLPSLYAQNTNAIGYDNDNFDTMRYDLNPTIEFRNILNAIRDDIFVNELRGEMNNLFFTLLNYIMSEQRFVDWAFKTSFISVLHKLRKLEQFPSFINDNQTYYEDYLNEVKPYRTKIRQYIADYEGDDEALISATDFDLPSYYDTDYGMWRSPSGEHARDDVIIDSMSAYEAWKNNHSYSIDYIIVEAAGQNYSADPAVKIEGGGGSGATAVAVIDYYTGSLIRVIVTNGGTGYTSTPTITIMGDGTGARCYPVLANHTVRSINTTLKFDRITYDSSVTVWEAGTEYAIGDLVMYAGVLYEVIADHTAGLTIDLTKFAAKDSSEIENAADRVMAFYTPAAGMPPKDLKQLFYGTEFPGVSIDGPKFARPADAGDYDNPNDLQNDTDLLDTIIQSDYDDDQLGIRPEDILVDGGAYVDRFHSHAPEELLPGIVYDTLDIQVYTVDPNAPGDAPIGFRINQRTRHLHELDNMISEFRRIAAVNITQLAQDLLITDTDIVVVDASALPKPGPEQGNPGVIYIYGEKITYWKIDYATNTLSQIRRGVHGTGAPALHKAGTDVVDASIDQLIPGDAANQTWLNVTSGDPYTIVDGNGLLLSNTEQAIFLKASTTKLPWLPGDYDWVDPNTGRYKFDMGPYDEQKGFDSYVQG